LRDLNVDGSKFLRNVGIIPHNCAASQPEDHDLNFIAVKKFQVSELFMMDLQLRYFIKIRRRGGDRRTGMRSGTDMKTLTDFVCL